MATKKRPPKPGKDYYWNGQEWIWIQRMGKPKTNPTARKPVAQPRRPVATVDQWAEKESSRIVESQLAAIRGQENAWRSGLQEEAKRRAEQAQRFAQMVQGMGLDAKIQGIFSNAGHDVAGFGQGFAGQTREIADAGAAEMTSLLGGDSTGVRNEGEAMGNVTYGMGGFIPSASLAAQGAAFASDAAMQPGFMLQQGLADSERFLHEGMQDNPFLDAILQTKLGKQEIKESLREQKIKVNMKAQEMRLDQMEADRKYWLAMQAMYLDQKKYKLAAQAEKRAQQAQTRYDQEARGMTPDGEVAPGFYRDPKSGRIIQNGYRPDGTRISTSGGKGSNGVTENAKAEWVDKVWAAQDNMTDYAKQVIERYSVFPASGPPAPSKIALLKRELMKRFAHLGRNHQTKQALRKLVGQVVEDMMRGGGGGTSGLFD